MKLGILGTGMIVQDLFTTIDLIPIEKKYLLGTPNTEAETAELTKKYNLDGYDLDYDALLERDIDTVYVALPNFLHYSFAKKALENGKHVIIEKPVTANATELKDLIAIAREKNLFILEAMNIHYLPTYKALKEKVEDVGAVKIVSFNYSQYSSRYNAFKNGDILPAFDYHKAGGALMDLNVYNLHGIIGIFGRPKSISYQANIQRGIDTSGIMLLDYGTFKAVSIGAKDCKAPVMLTIQGDQGVIRVDTPINQLKSFEYLTNTNESETVAIDNDKHRLYYEFVEFGRIIDSNDHAKAQEMLELSLTVSEVMEEAHKQAGIVFDNDLK